MNESKSPVHFVSTLEEAEALIRGRQRFWISNCGCREQRSGCSRSRPDVCLMFQEGVEASGSGKREVHRADVEAILKEAHEKNLVARPFRNADRTDVDGICFCCDDCCGYFLDPSELCDKGAFIEDTNMEECSQCAACVDLCYFGARQIDDDLLSIDRRACYGCGLCATVCPTACIRMVRRQN